MFNPRLFAQLRVTDATGTESTVLVGQHAMQYMQHALDTQLPETVQLFQAGIEYVAAPSKSTFDVIPRRHHVQEQESMRVQAL